MSPWPGPPAPPCRRRPKRYVPRHLPPGPPASRHWIEKAGPTPPRRARSAADRSARQPWTRPGLSEKPGELWTSILSQADRRELSVDAPKGDRHAAQPRVDRSRIVVAWSLVRE